MAAGAGPGMTYSVPGEIKVGNEMQRGFINDNVLISTWADRHLQKTKASWAGCLERIEKRGTKT